MAPYIARTLVLALRPLDDVVLFVQMQINDPDTVEQVARCHSTHEAASIKNRTILRTDITTFGENTGIIDLQFEDLQFEIDQEGVARPGRQTQVWQRFPDGWRLVSEHVSLAPLSSAMTAAAQIQLPIATEYLEAVDADLERVAAIARFLMAFPLDQNVQAAPRFLP
jgi:ketosteroid isomerase-like protein